MKATKSILLAYSVFAFLVAVNARAQSEAIPSWEDLFDSGGGGVLSSNVTGFINGGGGFAFSPNESIAVTALGFGGSDLTNSSYGVILYDAVGNQLASATITTGSSFYNQTYYENISPVDLISGDTYYIQAAEGPSGPNPNYWLGGVSSVFSVNSDISYLSASTGGFGPSPIPTVGSTLLPGDYYEAVNFQFIVVPEPSVLALGAAGLLGLTWRRWRSCLRSVCAG